MLPEDHSLRWTIFRHFFEQDNDVDPEWFDKLDDANPFDKGVIQGASEVYDAVQPLVDGAIENRPLQ